MKRLLSSLFSFLLFLTFPLLAHAAEFKPVTIYTSIPGPYDPLTTGPSGIVANFYQFALLLGGLLAFGAIVYGGIIYTFGAGNPEKQSEGKDRIVQALLGLLLLMGVYMLLHFINPDITSLKIATDQLTMYTSDKPPKFDDVTGINYAANYEKAKTDWDAAKARVAEKQKAIADLREQAADARDLGREDEEKRLNAQADALEKDTQLERSEDFARYSTKILQGGEEGDGNRITASAENADRAFQQAINYSNQKGDTAKANALVIEKYKADIDAEMMKGLASLNQLGQGGVGGLSAAEENLKKLNQMKTLAENLNVLKKNPQEKAAVLAKIQEATNKVQALYDKKNTAQNKYNYGGR